MISGFTSEFQALLATGGWVLQGLFALAFGIAFALISLWTALRLPDAPALGGREWLRLLLSGDPGGESLSVLRRALGQGDLEIRLEEVERQLFAAPARRLPFAFTLIGAAPLLGLLGTVTGMFTTFGGLAAASAKAPVDVISRGVSEALVTTQTGLVIGVPSLIACSLLKVRFDRLRLGYRRLASALLQVPRP